MTEVEKLIVAGISKILDALTHLRAPEVEEWERARDRVEEGGDYFLDED